MTLQVLKQNLKLLVEALKNPLVVISLILGLVSAPFLFYSGIFVEETIGKVFFWVYIGISTLDALIVLTLIVHR